MKGRRSRACLFVLQRLNRLPRDTGENIVILRTFMQHQNTSCHAGVPSVTCSLIQMAQCSALGVGSTLLLASALLGQGGRPTVPPNPPPPPVRPQGVTFDEQHVKLESTAPKPVIKTERDNCFLPPLSGIQLPTVGVSSLQLSSRAKKD